MSPTLVSECECYQSQSAVRLRPKRLCTEEEGEKGGEGEADGSQSDQADADVLSARARQLLPTLDSSPLPNAPSEVERHDQVEKHEHAQPHSTRRPQRSLQGGLAVALAYLEKARSSPDQRSEDMGWMVRTHLDSQMRVTTQPEASSIANRCSPSRNAGSGSCVQDLLQTDGSHPDASLSFHQGLSVVVCLKSMRRRTPHRCAHHKAAIQRRPVALRGEGARVEVRLRPLALRATRCDALLHRRGLNRCGKAAVRRRLRTRTFA
eukprot:6197058-Pleurochrysis_carterae.AAC.1